MPPQAPPLVIPVTLNTNQAKANLQSLQAALNQQVQAATAAVKQQNQQQAAATKAAAQVQTATIKAAAQQQVAATKAASQQQVASTKAASQQQTAATKAAAQAQTATIKANAQVQTATVKAASQQQAAATNAAARQQVAATNAAAKVQTATIKANAQVQTATIRAASKENTSSILSFARSFTALSVVREAAGWIKEAMQTIGESVRDAREHIKGLVDEMEKARQGSRELAALRGGKPTAGFTARIAREAASVGLSPDEYQKGSLAFEAHAGQFVGEEGATPDQLEKQGKKLSKDQALRLQQKVMGFAVAGRGMEGEDAFKLFGTILAKNKAGESDDKLMTDFAQILKIAELAPGHTSPQIGQIAELGQESVGEGGDIKNLKQAAYIIRVMSQRNPNEASTYGRALFRGLREFKFGEGDKAGEARAALGIRKDTDVFQDLQAIDEALKKEAAAGGNESAMISKYFPEIREFGGIRTAINEGIRNKGFQRAEAEAASVNAATAERATKDYLNSEEGRAQRDRSEEIAAARERSSRYVELRHIQSEVRKAQISSGELEVPEGMIGAYFTKGAASVFGAGSRQEQEERAETGRIIRERLLGSREGRRYMIEHDAGTRLDVGGHVGPLTDAEERTYAERAGRNLFNRTTPEDKLADMANLLKRIADSNERMAREGQGGPIPGGQPPMARGNGPRMGG